MILSKTDSVQQRESAVSREAEREYRVRKGEFVGLVASCGDRYRFLVRDLRHENPTIQGTGVNLPDALNTVKQLLNALADQRTVSDYVARS
ncbi:MAG TPA: hypothetical protein VF786_11465 [Terriglobales bacterium]